MRVVPEEAVHYDAVLRVPNRVEAVSRHRLVCAILNVHEGPGREWPRAFFVPAIEVRPVPDLCCVLRLRKWAGAARSL